MNVTPDIIVHPYYPCGVAHILTTGGSHYIGFVDDTTVLKYPHTPGTCSHYVEAQIYATLGTHRRILEFKGTCEGGILLSLASKGSLAAVLQSKQRSTSIKLKWVLQAAEAVEYIHLRNVLHCDLNATNFLLDDRFDLLLCDFQGRLLNPDGTVQIDGGVQENSKYRMPGRGDDEADIKTDIFALGSTLYHIIQGHPPFPNLQMFADEIAIRERFKSHKFPHCDLIPEASFIIHKCWAGTYSSAQEIVKDVRALRASLLQ